MTENNRCSTNCCGGPQELADGQEPFMDQDQGHFPWLLEHIDTPVGKVGKVKTQLEPLDLLGAVKVRLGISRNNYRVSPGLYAVGSPGADSHVLVTANYKLTFDLLRRELVNHNLWILVLDTKGINVWCAAGKGTFGTTELINRINQVHLIKVVSHRKLILPQLGAPGVAAHEIAKSTGFKVIYGPVKASDIPRFLQNNLQATENMRRVQFTFKDRLTVIPVELGYSVKLIPILFALLLIFNLVAPGEIRLAESFFQSLFNLIPYLVAFAMGTIGVAVFLPYIPFRSFALKGMLLGLIWAAIVYKYHDVFLFPDNKLILTAHSLFLISISSFFGLNFTGSTTFTSLSGVQKETLIAIPVIAAASVTALGLYLTSKIMLFLG